jgi:hypothetical protein
MISFASLILSFLMANLAHEAAKAEIRLNATVSIFIYEGGYFESPNLMPALMLILPKKLSKKEARELQDCLLICIQKSDRATLREILVFTNISQDYAESVKLLKQLLVNYPRPKPKRVVMAFTGPTVRSQIIDCIQYLEKQMGVPVPPPEELER